MPTLRFTPHEAQQQILNSDARFKVAACGRRFGKTVLAVMMALIEGLRSENKYGTPLTGDSEVVYFGVTLEQARRNAWHLFKEYGGPIAVKVHENTAVMTLQNGVRIRLLGMDNPDAARGMKLRFAILDEYADMPEHAWSEIIRPALADTQGGAFFIGTPKGKNHFYELAMCAENNPPTELPDGTIVHPFADYEFFNFAQGANPTIAENERLALAAEYTNGSAELYDQEITAKFVSRGGELFNADMFQLGPEPEDGQYYVAVDLSGFQKVPGKKEVKKRDDTAIAIVKSSGHKWWVKDIINGQWTVRETALRIVKACKDNHAVALGIEKGALLNAVHEPVMDNMEQLNCNFPVQDQTNGNQPNFDRTP